MNSRISEREAALAAKRILNFYDTIPAADPKAFAAGLAAILMIFQREVVERAVDPVCGLPSVVSYPNLAKFREHLDRWRGEYLVDESRRERANRKALPAPEPDPEADARIAKGLQELAEHLKRGFGPSTASS